MTMGTASTMACLAEALGITLPGNAAIPAPDSRRNVLAHESGRRIVGMVRENLTIDRILTRPAFENAIRVLAAIGGSTNAVVHLLAIARRLGVPLELADFDALGTPVPLLVNLAPSGKYLMEDLYYAGGLPAVLRALAEGGLLAADALTVNGASQGANCTGAPNYNAEVIGSLAAPVGAAGGVAVLRGNLSPAGAIIKPSAATPRLCKHRGRALVFSSVEHMKATIDDPALDVDADTVLVLQGAGPVGYPGMPEVGNMPLPRKLLAAGVTDMVRISDARMSGTAYGTVVLHCVPESAVGGPLALVRTGDWIELDVAARRLELDVPAASRGYVKMYCDNVRQADEGCDLGFLQGASGHGVPRESH